MPLESAINHLETAKLKYLYHKKQHSTLRDKHVNSNSERKKELKILRKREKSKNKWKRYRLAFGKSRMNSISEVEHNIEGFIVITSNQFEIEQAIMKENSARFTLAYSSPLLQSPLLDKIGLFAEKETGKQLISQGEVEFEGESELTALLSLFYKGNSIKIQSYLDVVTWQNHWKQAT